MKEFEKQIREEHDANCTCGFHEPLPATTVNMSESDSYQVANNIKRNKSRLNNKTK